MMYGKNCNSYGIFAPYRSATILVQPNINHALKYRTHAQISIHTPKYWTHAQISIHSPKYGTHTQIPTTCSISWCDNLVPNVYGTEVFLTCSLHDAQDVIIFQVEWFSSFVALRYLLFIQTHALEMRIHHQQKGKSLFKMCCFHIGMGGGVRAFLDRGFPNQS